ncbi:MAG: hypothetical protein WCE21_01780 [Candidatus Babeliales bacterium]
MKRLAIYTFALFLMGSYAHDVGAMQETESPLEIEILNKKQVSNDTREKSIAKMADAFELLTEAFRLTQDKCYEKSEQLSKKDAKIKALEAEVQQLKDAANVFIPTTPLLTRMRSKSLNKSNSAIDVNFDALKEAKDQQLIQQLQAEKQTLTKETESLKQSNTMLVKEKEHTNRQLEQITQENTELVKYTKEQLESFQKSFTAAAEQHAILQEYLNNSESSQNFKNWQENVQKLKELRSTGYVIESMRTGLKTAGNALHTAHESKAETCWYQSLAWLSGGLTPPAVIAAFFKEKLWHDRTAQFAFGASSAWGAFSIYQANKANNARNNHLQTAAHIKQCLEELD